MYTVFFLSFFLSFVFCLDICRVSVKCVVNVFYSIKILGAYKLRTSRTSGDINFALARGPKGVWCLVSMCLCLCSVELRECEVERERKKWPIRWEIAHVFLSQWFCRNVDANLHEFSNDLHMKTIKSHKTCKTNELLLNCQNLSENLLISLARD